MSVIFSIDGEANAMARNQFLGWVAGLPLMGGIGACIGVYKGQAEYSFIMDSGDFAAHVWGSHWIAGQESILHVASGNKMECRLQFLNGQPDIGLGCMHQVEQSEAIASGDYTHRLPCDQFPNGAWYIARVGNPDINHGAGK